MPNEINARENSLKGRKFYTEEIHMLVLQILIVPFFALLLIGAVFVIGATATSVSGYADQGDLPAPKVDDPDAIRVSSPIVSGTQLR